MKILLKRVYNPSESTDGKRILVDRLWPRGLSKDKAKVDFWPRDIAPSTELRKWYKHDSVKWDEFCFRYNLELDTKQDIVYNLLQYVDDYKVTFVYGSKEQLLNNAVALRNYLEKLLK